MVYVIRYMFQGKLRILVIDILLAFSRHSAIVLRYCLEEAPS